MKAYRFLGFVVLSTVAIALLPTLANSQSSSGVNPSSCLREPQSYLEPEKLAILAYQGYLEKQGIPGYIAFNTEFATGEITGQTVVQAAVAGCLLSQEAAHENYIQEVQQQIQLLFQEDLGR